MNIYIFRGKSATGKTTLTNILSKKLNVPVLRKDDIFDALSNHESDTAILNSASYDILAKQIQTCIDNKTDIIVDIALGHTPSLKKFLSKIDSKDSTVHHFFCDCSDNDIWIDRWKVRLKNPMPNQYFKNINEIITYYDKCEIKPLNGEIVLDSIKSADELIDIITENIFRLQ